MNAESAGVAVSRESSGIDAATPFLNPTPQLLALVWLSATTGHARHPSAADDFTRDVISTDPAAPIRSNRSTDVPINASAFTVESCESVLSFIIGRTTEAAALLSGIASTRA